MSCSDFQFQVRFGKRGLNEWARNIDSCQPARTMQADKCQNLFAVKDNPSINKSCSQSFRRSLKFHSKCKRLMTWSIHPGH